MTQSPSHRRYWLGGIGLCFLAVIGFASVSWMQFWSTFPRYEAGFAFSEEHPIRYYTTITAALASVIAGCLFLVRAITLQRSGGGR